MAVNTNLDEITPSLEPVEIVLMLLAVAGGTFAAAVILPMWLPGLTTSLLGDQPKAYWYLARASGFVAYLVMWLSVAFGLIITNRLVRLWNGGPTAVELHQFTTWLALALTVFHALILLGDRYIQSTPKQVLLPFGYVNYKPEWVGIGQIAFYLAVVVAVSFYFRKQIGYKTWRRLHYLSFVVYVLITAHGVLAGTDGPSLLAVYAISLVATYLLVMYRVLVGVKDPNAEAHRPVPARPAAAGATAAGARPAATGPTAVARPAAATTPTTPKPPTPPTARPPISPPTPTRPAPVVARPAPPPWPQAEE